MGVGRTETGQQEAEAIRYRCCGDPVRKLTLHATHWLEAAITAHPEKQQEIDDLSLRLEVACGELSDEHGFFADLSTVNDVAVALREIAAVMWEAAPYVIPTSVKRNLGH